MTIKGEYLAVKGSQLSNEDAARIGPELVRLAQAGCSTSEGIVEAAREESSPLHAYVYNCDAGTAAKRYYVNRAEKIARSILIRIETANGGARIMRAFYPIRKETRDGNPDRLRHYLPFEVVRSRPEYACQPIEEARRQLVSWRDRWLAYRDEFGGVFAAIDEVLVEKEEEV